jgi:broad specificity phosphatase PhoE
MGLRSTLIYLFRHGEVVLADRRRFIGHLDVPLSPTGERQCAAQADRLREARLTAMFSSDLSRARRSGEIIGAPHHLTPVELPALREMAMGRWDGLSAAEIEAREPQAFAAWMTAVGEFPFPGGESVPALASRAWPALEAIAARHRGQSVAVVAHGGTNRALLCRVLGVPFARLLAFGQDYGAVSLLEHRDERWVLRRLNERPVI